MHPVQRIEIIANSKEMDKLLDCLDRVGVPGYTVIRNVIGKSERGLVSDDYDFASTKLSNVYIICCCPPEQVKPIVAEIRPLLNKFGGVCYISDATEVRSMRCVSSM
jgi:nitrogen regulatory protein PII